MTAMLRVALRLGADLDNVFNHINNQLVEDLPEEHFITAFLGILDTRAHVATFHSGGQGPLLHFRAATGEFRWLTPSMFPLGFMTYESMKPAETVALEPGDIFALISDGVYEYGDARGRQFGMQGVEEVVRAHHERPMAELLETLVAQARQFAGGEPQQDDVTLVLLRRTPPPHRAHARLFGDEPGGG
jgi:phosphoserine phosphatase